jgi:hypothetical protein
MDFSLLRRGEFIAMGASVLLVVSVFLPWYFTDGDNPNSQINGASHADGITAWATFSILRFLLLLAAIAPFVLAWIVVRAHKLSWPRGEVTSIIALAVIVLVVYNGIIDKPGDPNDTISLGIGWFLALAAGILMLVGSVIRSGESERRRRPPGTFG